MKIVNILKAFTLSLSQRKRNVSIQTSRVYFVLTFLVAMMYFARTNLLLGKGQGACSDTGAQTAVIGEQQSKTYCK